MKLLIRFLSMAMALGLFGCGTGGSDTATGNMPVKSMVAEGSGSGVAAGGTGVATFPATTCSVAQLEAELGATLASVNTDTDFSFVVERSDGRRYSYNRGASTPETRYESASTSKLVTAVVILRLVEQGYLKLTDRPQDHIAAWPINRRDPLYHMTLAQLLSFTSGLTKAPLCLNLPRANFAACVNSIASSNANNGIMPGTQFYYASTHLQVAGLMALRARGLATWEELFNEFRTQTGLFPGGAYDLPSLSNPRLAGGMHWTGTEYLAFLKALKDGKLLNARSMSEFLKDRTADGVTIVASPVMADIGEDWHYGFGFWHECQSPTFNCSPGTRISSPGAYGAYPFWDLSKDYFGIVARQGALKTGPEGIAVERSVRPQVEAWAACQ
jgi:CubicO group peptidase (beta-lactamase class C family)